LFPWLVMIRAGRGGFRGIVKNFAQSVGGIVAAPGRREAGRSSESPFVEQYRNDWLSLEVVVVLFISRCCRALFCILPS
jgi:hypothetical protein